MRTSRGVSHPKFAPSGVFASLAALADAREKSLKEREEKRNGANTSKISNSKERERKKK